MLEGFPRSKHGLVLAMVLLTPLLLLAPGAVADGPRLEITSHEDGGWVTDPDIVLEGCATAPRETVVLGRGDLGDGLARGVSWQGDDLVLNPKRLFADDFTGTSLDTEKWVLVESGGTIRVNGNRLILQQTTSWPRTYPLIRSTLGIFPDDADWLAEFKLRFDTAGYEGGGGISRSAGDAPGGHLSTYTRYEGWNNPRQRIYANGQPVINYTNVDFVERVYTLTHAEETGEYVALMDGNEIAAFTASRTPQCLWFGAIGSSSTTYYTTLSVDYAHAWSFSGRWTSEPFQTDHRVALDNARALYTTTHMRDVVVGLEMRSSPDNLSWSDWTLVEDGNLTDNLDGKWFQARLRLSLPNVLNTRAGISVSGLELVYHHPAERVEVRRGGGEWSEASGNESWSAPLSLEENENTIWVRGTDSSGAVSTTFIELILDTTAPTGTMEILKDREFTNNLRAVLHFRATDRYGVEWIELSNGPDFYISTTFPYTESLEWMMDGKDGEVGVWARFIDSHGLRSDVVTDSIIYDSIPPFGRILIEEGWGYTPSLRVDLELEHRDTRGVARVELSNDESFTDSQVVPTDQLTVYNWTLAEGGDGPRTVFMRMTDLAGNSAVVNSTIELYIPKPAGNISIEGGAEYTDENFVNLEIAIPLTLHASRMQISNDAAFLNANWEKVAKERPWLLASGDGERRVYIRFEDFRGIVSVPVWDSIVLDTIPPEVTVTLNDGSFYTTLTHVVASVRAGDLTSITGMWLSPVDRFNEAERQVYATAFNWTVPAEEGRHSLHVQLRDSAGNLGVGHATVYFATKHPSIILSLPDGPVSGEIHSIPIDVLYTDEYGDVEVQLSFDEDPPAHSTWVPVNGTLQVTIPDGTGDGSYEVQARARNLAGLTSAVESIAVTLDRTPPDVSITSPIEGSTIPQRGSEVLLAIEAGDPSGIDVMSYSLDGGEWTEIGGDWHSTSVDLGDFGPHTIEVRAQDRAGNEATDLTSFTLEDKEANVAGGSSMTWILVLLLIVVVTGVLFEVFWRRPRHERETTPAMIVGPPGTEGEVGPPVTTGGQPSIPPQDGFAPAPPAGPPPSEVPPPPSAPPQPPGTETAPSPQDRARRPPEGGASEWVEM